MAVPSATRKKQAFDPVHPLSHVGPKAFIGLILTVAVVVYYTSRYAKGAQLLATLFKATPGLIIVMLLVETVYLVLQGGLLRGVYRAVGFQRGMTYLTGMYLGMNLVNTIAPVAGLSGSVYMMHFEKRRGLGRSDTFLINFLYYLTDYLVFLLVLLAGVAYLVWSGQATRVILITTLVFTLFALSMLTIGLVIFTHPTALRRLSHALNRFASWVIRRKELVIPEERVESFAEGALAAWQRSRAGFGNLGGAAVSALFLHVTCLALLWLAFRTFQIPIGLEILVAGYTVATLLNIVSPTPGGIGIAEGGMTAVFAALGVPVEQALLVALLYRTVFIWYPLGLGLVAIHILPRLADREIAAGVY